MSSWSSSSSSTGLFFLFIFSYSLYFSTSPIFVPFRFYRDQEDHALVSIVPASHNEDSSRLVGHDFVGWIVGRVVFFLPAPLVKATERKTRVDFRQSEKALFGGFL